MSFLQRKDFVFIYILSLNLHETPKPFHKNMGMETVKVINLEKLATISIFLAGSKPDILA